MRFDTRSFLFLILLKLMTKLVTQFVQGLKEGGLDSLQLPLRGVGEGSLLGILIPGEGSGLEKFRIWVSGVRFERGSKGLTNFGMREPRSWVPKFGRSHFEQNQLTLGLERE